MSAPHRLWLAAHHHPAFGNGGWAYVRAGAGEVAGAAGGDRRTGRLAMLMAGLADALKAAPSGDLELTVAADDVPLVAPLAGAAPPEDADPALYAPVVAALAGRTPKLFKVAAPAGTAVGFAAAWAEHAAEKAKAQGGFRAAIPKPNLAKVPGL
jgi:hypothetical protein